MRTVPVATIATWAQPTSDVMRKRTACPHPGTAQRHCGNVVKIRLATTISLGAFGGSVLRDTTSCMYRFNLTGGGLESSKVGSIMDQSQQPMPASKRKLKPQISRQGNSSRMRGCLLPSLSNSLRLHGADVHRIKRPQPRLVLMALAMALTASWAATKKYIPLLGRIGHAMRKATKKHLGK